MSFLLFGKGTVSYTTFFSILGKNTEHQKFCNDRNCTGEAFHGCYARKFGKINIMFQRLDLVRKNQKLIFLIITLDTSNFPVLLKNLVNSLSEFFSHLYSVASPYLQFHYFNSPFKQKFSCKYVFQMRLVDLSKTDEQMVLSVSCTLMIMLANWSQKTLPGLGILTIMEQHDAKFSQGAFGSNCEKWEFQQRSSASVSTYNGSPICGNLLACVLLISVLQRPSCK